MVQERILVLGASSWLGYLLINKLNKEYPACKLAGTLHKQLLTFEHDVALFHTGSLEDFQKVLAKFQPSSVVNFLRGEDESGLRIHKAIIDYCQRTNSYYLYASSALALDGYSGRALTEQILAKGISPYGAFKAGCEQSLYDSPIQWSVLRFASVQGWVPHKTSRNQAFLQKLAQGQKIRVDRGVLQNRMMASRMIDGISVILAKRIEGIIHFGATDASEEFHFLKKQAELFGYDPDSILEGERRAVNLFTIPNRIFSELGEEYRLSEQDTLRDILQSPGLEKYRKS